MTEPTDTAVLADAARADAERTQAAVLAERAAALAVPVRGDDDATAEVLVLAVAIGEERYGIDATRVVEVQTLVGLSRVPGLSAWWAGVVNVRGTLRPVLDLADFLAVPAPAAGREPKKVTYVAGAGLVVGLLVDDAVELRSVPLAQVGPPPAGSAAAARGQVRGTTADLLTVLDVDRLLADPRLAAGEEPV
jgi:purine-binding chemotaxis protein CheW